MLTIGSVLFVLIAWTYPLGSLVYTGASYYKLALGRPWDIAPVLRMPCRPNRSSRDSELSKNPQGKSSFGTHFPGFLVTAGMETFFLLLSVLWYFYKLKKNYALFYLFLSGESFKLSNPLSSQKLKFDLSFHSFTILLVAQMCQTVFQATEMQRKIPNGLRPQGAHSIPWETNTYMMNYNESHAVIFQKWK